VEECVHNTSKVRTRSVPHIYRYAMQETSRTERNVISSTGNQLRSTLYFVWDYNQTQNKVVLHS